MKRRAFVAGLAGVTALGAAKAAPAVKTEVTVRFTEELLYQVVRVKNSLVPEIGYSATSSEVQDWINSGVDVIVERAF